MWDFTNLAWPETPFGADQRPFGKRAHMLAAFDIASTSNDEVDPLPRCVAVVYVRVNPARPLSITPTTLRFGLRATVPERPGDLHDLLGVLDRALLRARRHAFVLAGHQLGDQLARLDHLTPDRLAGVGAVLDAWETRDSKTRGMARLHDTADSTPTAPLDVALEQETTPASTSAPAIAATTLARCLAVGLTAGFQSGLMQWEGAFAARDALAVAGWDLLGTPVGAF